MLQLRQILQRLQLADQVTLVLFDPDSERVSFYGLDAHRQPVSYQDETLLANGPVSRLRQSPLPQRWQSDDLHARYPQIGALALYLPFNQYCLMPLHAGGTLIGGC
ncbi:Formate hydrogenlyase transcriptional activator [compost metagenome]